MNDPASCPVCGGGATRLAYRPQQPVMMHRLYDTAEAARACVRGTLDIRRCLSCGFAWNAAFDPALVQYDDAYENDQTASDIFAAEVEQRAATVVATVPSGEPIDFLEVGCGQGGFLRLVARVAGPRLRSSEGFDPAWRGGETDGADGIRVHKCYFSSETAHLLRHAPNVVATRHTIEHVPDPVDFLSAIRAALGPASQATLFVETPCIDWIVDNRVMQDLFYEHCSIFTPRAMAIALQRAGFGAARITHVFEGQYLWAQARALAAPAAAAATTPEPSPPWAADAEDRFVRAWRMKIEAAAQRGAVALWGAGAKGVTFASLVDPDGTRLRALIDIHTPKQGKFVAGAGHPISSPALAAGLSLATIFVMNPNYLDEIAAMARTAGIEARLLPVTDHALEGEAGSR